MARTFPTMSASSIWAPRPFSARVATNWDLGLAAVCHGNLLPLANMRSAFPTRNRPAAQSPDQPRPKDRAQRASATAGRSIPPGRLRHRREEASRLNGARIRLQATQEAKWEDTGIDAPAPESLAGEGRARLLLQKANGRDKS